MLSEIQIVKENLKLAITQLCSTSWMFVKNPDRDFTRERKLPLRQVISMLLCMEGGSLTGELLRYFGCNRYTPSSSAFIQQRQFLPSTTSFDYLPTSSRKHDPFTSYHLPFRVVRFKISDTAYETVITNLDDKQFPSEELKHLYSMRWGIETSFRELKYTVGLLHFHAKKVENITQEIFARLIMYNFTELITSRVVIQKPNRKYPYKANFSVAVQVCRQFLLGNISPPDVEETIGKNLSVTRSGRSNPRSTVVKHAVSFLYRVA